MGKKSRQTREAQHGTSGAAAQATSDASPAWPGPASLASLTALGTLSALWALFLWAELLVARAGGATFCAFGGETACVAVWNSSFASAIHARTGLPIAGWGLVWGVVAFALPLLALRRAPLGRPVAALLSAVRLAAAAGVVTIGVMLAVIAAERAFCASCAVSYLLVGVYAGIALLGWKGLGLPEAGRGFVLAATAVMTVFLALLYPGSRTPRSGGQAGREAVASAARPAPGSSRSGDAARDAQLRQLVESLQPELKQTLSDSLHIYRTSAPVPAPAPRSLDGPADAPVRITEFTDVRCGHCAELHETLDTLRESVPAGSFNVESRQFPLDGECNPLVEGRRDPVRCLVASARICLEGKPGGSAFAAATFERQATLTRDQVFQLAAPYVERKELEACLASEVSRRKLADDIGYASRFDPDGTPIVVVNGRKGTSFGPFLYAMVLTGGADSNPAFDALPPPNPRAPLH
jgi:protein-disulfide isomerase